MLGVGEKVDICGKGVPSGAGRSPIRPIVEATSWTLVIAPWTHSSESRPSEVHEQLTADGPLGIASGPRCRGSCAFGWTMGIDKPDGIPPR